MPGGNADGMRALLTRIEQATGLDRIGDRLQQSVQRRISGERVRDLLHGVWLGHPLHPVLIQVPMGAWLSAAVLDLLPNHRRAATTLIGIGTVAALPAAITGANDWASLSREQRRIGLVHAAANAIALACYAGSTIARIGGRHPAGRRLGFAGLAAAGAGGFLGGHLAYKQAAGVNQAVPELHRISAGWHPIVEFANLPESGMASRQVDDVPVLVYRHGEDVTVLLAHCAHQNGPLDQGEVISADGHACVVCPWHGSAFRLTDGTVAHGPAATDQQVLRSRVVAGVVQAQLP
ncbi:Rieske 2Fe-2S domain-containing protein [Solwaraspora sp. WMMB335]|uniref:Rieske 2Fe-2S domain-containing protein n=1 Tax=Solwaraspora sp. WMMB335 TaxID=3404118 RepID=UPI003B939332